MIVYFPFAYYHPEQCAGQFVLDDVSETLAQMGFKSQITVPTPTRNVPKDAVWSRDEVLCGGKVRVHRFRMYGEGKNPVLRALRYLLCEVVQLHYMLWKDYDVAFIDSTPPIQGLKLSIVRLFRRKKRFVYNAQDLFPETLSGAGLAKRGGLLWMVGMWVSNVTFRYSDKIIAISQDIKRSIVARGVPEERIEVIYNWVDENAVQPMAKEENPLYEEFGLSRDAFTVVYAGNLGNAQNIGIILDAAPHLLGVQFVIFGTGGLEDEIRARISKEKMQNVKLLPLQPSERVSQVYSLGDACVVSCKAGLGGSAMPSKTWTIMSCGRPVIASFDEGELKEIIEGTSAASICSATGSEAARPCGVFTHAGNVTEFVEAVRSLMTDRERCAQMGSNARQFILDNLTKDVGTRKYVEVIKQFAGES